MPLTESPSADQLAKFVWVTSRFAAFHRWNAAPDSVAYLRDYHRHVFHVKLTMQVGHGDREVEFFTLKDKLNDHLRDVWEGTRFEFSCEQIAEMLLVGFGAAQVEVSEDGENGATISAPIALVRPDQAYVQDNILEAINKANVAGREQDAATTNLGDVFADIRRAPASTRRISLSRLVEKLTPSAAQPLDPNVLKTTRTVATVPFFGFEVEGPHRGRPTMFVPGSCSPRQFVDAYNEFVDEANQRGVHDKDFQVYLGAGNDRKIRMDTFRHVTATVRSEHTVVEVENLADAGSDTHRHYFLQNGGTIVVLSPDDYRKVDPAHRERVWLKVVDERGKEVRVYVRTAAGEFAFRSSLLAAEYKEDVTDSSSFVRRMLARKIEAAR